jgi:hypothetical protein
MTRPRLSTPRQPTSRTEFTRAEQTRLHDLRARYQVGQDLFSPSEWSRLRFVRWLYEQGRLMS